MTKLLTSLLALLVAVSTPVDAAAPMYEKVYYTKKEALIKAFDGNTFTEKNVILSDDQKAQIEDQVGWTIHEKAVTIYSSGNKDAIILNDLGKHYPITFLVTVENTNSIDSILVMTYREKIGAQVRKKRFLNQFRQKTLQDPIQVNYDITNITGATVSSWTISNGARKALAITQTINL